MESTGFLYELPLVVVENRIETVDLHEVSDLLEQKENCRILLERCFLKFSYPRLACFEWTHAASYELIEKYQIGDFQGKGLHLYFLDMFDSGTPVTPQEKFEIDLVDLEADPLNRPLRGYLTLEFPDRVSQIVTVEDKTQTILKWIDVSALSPEIALFLSKDMIPIVIEYAREEMTWKDFHFRIVFQCRRK